jgi:two-component sensor histidine kinase/ABC-type amino acid transport substrate-binding protein/putative methionine-R-sulfoxide reductase with GAF domain
MLRYRSVLIHALAFLATALSTPPCHAGNSSPLQHPRRVMASASELDYPPFSVIREDGSADGFSVELLRAVAEAAGYDITFKVGPWDAIKRQLIDGQLDALPLVSYSEARDKFFDFTAPYLRMYGTIFVRKGDTAIRGEADLKNKEVLVMRGDTAHEYAVQKHLSNHLILTESFADALRQLSAGKHDAVIVQQLVGLQLIKKLNITNLVSLRSVQASSLKLVAKPLSGFEQKFCIAVKEGDKRLLAHLNEGLAIVIASGVYDQLYDKWFGPILPKPSISLAMMVKYLLLILLPLFIVFGLLGIWYLKREVSRKTKNLRAQIRISEAAEKALQDSYTRLELLATVAQRLLGAENPQLIVEELCQLVMAHIDCQVFFNYLVETPGERMRLNAWAGIPQESADTIRHLDFGVAVCGCVARDGTRIIAEGIQRSDDPHVQLRKSFGVRAFCCHPLMIQDELIGTLFFGTRTRSNFSDDQVALMKSVADQVAVAIQRLQATRALRESEARLKASLAEKEVLLKEIHHRVKNNMQVISSLVDLQADEVQDVHMREVFQDVINRVRSMAMVHEKLYQSSDLARVEFADYGQSLLGYLWRAYGASVSGVRLDLDLAPVFLPVNVAVPCGLILNELFSNALKHAFTGRESGAVTVSLRENVQGAVQLRVGDNGMGLPPELNWEKARSLGLRLVQMLARQLHAAVEVASDQGTQFTITFEGPKS